LCVDNTFFTSENKSTIQKLKLIFGTNWIWDKCYELQKKDGGLNNHTQNNLFLYHYNKYIKKMVNQFGMPNQCVVLLLLPCISLIYLFYHLNLRRNICLFVPYVNARIFY